MKKTIYLIFFSLLLLFLTFSIFSAMNLSFFGYQIYKVKSGSMNPYLNINDLIIVKKVNKYKINDVVTYRNADNSTTTHRIVNIKNKKIITKGDANNIEDLAIKKEQIIGKVIFVIHNIGFVNYLLNKPLFWFLLFSLGLMITILIPDKK